MSRNGVSIQVVPSLHHSIIGVSVTGTYMTCLMCPYLMEMSTLLDE